MHLEKFDLQPLVRLLHCCKTILIRLTCFFFKAPFVQAHYFCLFFFFSRYAGINQSQESDRVASYRMRDHLQTEALELAVWSCSQASTCSLPVSNSLKGGSHQFYCALVICDESEFINLKGKHEGIL